MSDSPDSLPPGDVPVSKKTFVVKEKGRITPGFVIKGISTGYEPRKGPQPYSSLQKDTVATLNSNLVARNSRHVNPDAIAMPSQYQYSIFVEPKARETIFKHIGWHNPKPENSVEQGGILIGEVVETPNGRFFGIVKQSIPAHFAQGSSAYLKVDHSAWKEMYDIMDSAPQEESAGYIIGWYHTHPRNLEVFMSGTDLNTQRTTFSSHWHFAIVMNPHKHIWKAFHGPEATECPGYMLKPDSCADVVPVSDSAASGYDMDETLPDRGKYGATGSQQPGKSRRGRKWKAIEALVICLTLCAISAIGALLFQLQDTKKKLANLTEASSSQRIQIADLERNLNSLRSELKIKEQQMLELASRPAPPVAMPSTQEATHPDAQGSVVQKKTVALENKSSDPNKTTSNRSEEPAPLGGVLGTPPVNLPLPILEWPGNAMPSLWWSKFNLWITSITPDPLASKKNERDKPTGSVNAASPATATPSPENKPKPVKSDGAVSPTASTSAK